MLIAGADPEPWRSTRVDQLENAKIPIYPNLDALLEKHRPNLTVIAAPAYLHKRLTIEALRQESHVLCEKPAAATLRQAIEMRSAQQKNGRTVAIGFQWSFSPTITSLKRDIAAGAFGRPLRLKALVLWPRNGDYYRRNSWAGRIWSSGGEPICDNPVSNACAHYLHNMLYVLGQSPTLAAAPTSIECETYRLNEIENFDTAVIRLATTADTELFFVTSHATTASREPLFQYEFEDAVITYDLGSDARVVARWKDGRVHDYGELPTGTCVQKLWATIDVIRTLAEVPCGIDAALPHMAVVSAVQQAPIAPLSKSAVTSLGDNLTECYEKWSLPSELPCCWAAPRYVAPISPINTTADILQNTEPVRKRHLV
jgi:predicted dehydrogenase